MFSLLPFALAENLVLAFGEEIGWRGFLAPTFYRARSFGWARIVTGIIWGLRVRVNDIGGPNASAP